MSRDYRWFCLVAGMSLLGCTSGFGADSAYGGFSDRSFAVRDVKRLDERYSRILEESKRDILAALPRLDERKKAAYLAARKAEEEALTRRDTARAALGKIGAAQGLIGHAKGHWIAQADRGIAQAEAAVKRAGTDAERAAAEQELARWQQNRAEGVQALKERTAAYEKLKRDEPRLQREAESAEKILLEASAHTVQCVADLGVLSILQSDRLDAKLAQYIVLSEAQPARLAAFAAESRAQEALVDEILADTGLLLQMAEADGARDGLYADAFKIYDAIRKSSEKAAEGPLQRLALAISLEHAKPIGQRNAVADTDAPEHIDPVARYLNFEAAYLQGELDKSFPGLRVWDYRHVVDGEEPNEILSWGREMLRSYRPDHIATGDERWRYVAAVRTEIRYGSQEVQHDREDLQFFQNILSNGGVCGRRAFFGRFILRAFGVPTTARPQKGHAALVRWTPDGWVPVLGAGWGSGWTKTRYGADRNFLANTQARAAGVRFLEVKRAQWIGDVFGEKPVYGLDGGSPGLWYGISLYHQRSIIAAQGAKDLGPVGEELAEANESNIQYAFASAELQEDDLKIRVDTAGVITIPAVASSDPTQSTGRIIFMDSYGGGQQLHYSRGASGQQITYTFQAPEPGVYEIAARVATPSWDQAFLLEVNGADPIEMPLPHTIGLWGLSTPLQISLNRGRNVLRLVRKDASYPKGISIKDFTLVPVGNRAFWSSMQRVSPPVETSGTPARTPRRLPPANQTALERALVRSLAQLSDGGLLTEIPLRLSVARQPVWLQRAGADGILTFQLIGQARTADIPWTSLTVGDHATLAALVATLRRESSDAQAMAGVYLEHAGSLQQADTYFAKADPASRSRLEKLFE